MASTGSESAPPEPRNLADQKVFRRFLSFVTDQPKNHSQLALRNREVVKEARTEWKETASNPGLLGQSFTKYDNWEGIMEGPKSNSSREIVGAYRPDQLTMLNGNLNSSGVGLSTSKIPRLSGSNSGRVGDGSPHIGHYGQVDDKMFLPPCVEVSKLLGNNNCQGGGNAQRTTELLRPMENRLGSKVVLNFVQNKQGLDTDVLRSVVGNIPWEPSHNILTKGKPLSGPCHHSHVDRMKNPRDLEQKKKSSKPGQGTPVDGEMVRGIILSEDTESCQNAPNHRSSDDKENEGKSAHFSEVSPNSFTSRGSHETQYVEKTAEVAKASDHLKNHILADTHSHGMKSRDIVEHVDSPPPVHCEVIEWASVNGWRVVFVGLACILLLISSVPPTALRDFVKVREETRRSERTQFILMCNPVQPILHMCMSDPDHLYADQDGGLCLTMPEIVLGLKKCPHPSDKANSEAKQISVAGPSHHAQRNIADLYKDTKALLVIGFSVCVLTLWILRFNLRS